MINFINYLPKAELHLHIEGSLEPELMFRLAKRNKKTIKYSTVEDLKKAYQFNNLQEFLDIYYEGAAVLINEEDFYDMTMAYLEKCQEQNIRHTEIFFDPQTHIARGIAFSVIIEGIRKALKDAELKWGISSEIILCFLRHLTEEDAIKTLKEALPYKTSIIGVGLDSSELGHPPSKFKNVFEMAKKEGFLTVAHAGEEGPSEYVWEALNTLKVNRIDHGNRSLEDKKLVDELVNLKMALTVCPLSNLKLGLIKKLSFHPMKKMLKANLLVTINSDDPAYFGGYLNENYIALQEALQLTKQEIITLTKNSFEASFASKERKELLFADLNAYIKNFNC